MSTKDTDSMLHLSYRCKYHIVLVPKYRRVVIYNKLRADIIEIIRAIKKENKNGTDQLPQIAG